jgi:hypothetical protein
MPASFSSPLFHARSGARRAAVALLLAGALALAGCTTDTGQEEVKFDTVPSGAAVLIDGTPIGQTPTSALLANKRDTVVVFQKFAFDPVVIHVHPDNQWHLDGHALTPNPITQALRPELLPAGAGDHASPGLDDALAKTQQYFAMGHITEEDRAYIEARLREFYTGARPAVDLPPAPAKP